MTEENNIKPEPDVATAPEIVKNHLENWVSYPEHLTVTLPTEAGQKAVSEALSAIKDRSYSGRHPELGKMIQCQFCGMRHREHDTFKKCEQKFATTNRQGDPVQGELLPPEGLATLTERQIVGAKYFAKRRQRARNKPKSKMHYWLRVILDAAKRKNDKEI